MYAKIRMDNILELHRGYDLPERDRKDGSVPIISSSGYSGMHDTAKCSGENVITGRYGTIGEVFYHNGDCWPLNTALYVSNFKNNHPIYIYYLLKHVLKVAVDGKDKSTVPGVDRNVLHQMEVPFCADQSEQRKIVLLLETIDKKISVNRALNDNLQQQMFMIYEAMMVGAEKKKIPGRNITAKEITEVITGKEDANFSTSGGEYKFFTCSTTPLKCDEAAFDSASILIAGNGDFNVKHYTGKFNAYQRTYVLTPPDKYYALLYLASLYRINSFKSASAGSIVKFITKGDVENIPLFIPDNELYLQQLNSLVRLQEQISTENEKLISLRDWLLPMLMNGQATISD